MTFQTLRVVADPDVLWVTLDRPDQQNAINGRMLGELGEALELAERSPDCRMVVLAGSGGVFCSGMDFADATRSGVTGTGPDTEDLARRGGTEFFGLLERLTAVPRVVVANVDGRVTGGGVGIAAASDLVYASSRSTFGLPEALWGLLPCSVLPFLVRRTGLQPARAMTLSTLPVPAGRACQIGLVDEVADDAEAALRRLRVRLGRLDPATIGDAKSYLARLAPWPVELERLAVDEFTRLMSSPQVQQRLAGFVERQAFPWEQPAAAGGRP